MANDSNEDEALSKEVIHFLNKSVGTEKSSASEVFCLLQDALKKKKNLETEVSIVQKMCAKKVSLAEVFYKFLRAHIFTCERAHA